MEFGLDKYSSFVIKRGKIVESDDITLPDDEKIRNLQDEST